MLSEAKIKKLKTLSELIVEGNEKHNLTSYKDGENFFFEQIDDCVQAYNICSQSVKENLIDYGSGSGIPGLVWAILNEKIKVLSIDSSQKKIEFQKTLIRKLELQNAACKHTRLEEHSFSNEHTAVFKAFSTLKTAIQKSKPNKKRANLLFLKKNNEKTQEEILEIKPLLYDYKIHTYKSNLGDMCVVEIYDN